MHDFVFSFEFRLYRCFAEDAFERIDLVLNVVAELECRDQAFVDEDCFASAGVACRASLAGLAGERAETANLNSVAVDELLAGKSDLVVCERGGKIVTTDINFALITDRMYKNKLKEGDLDRYSEAELAEMKAICEAKHQGFVDLYKIMDEISY